MHACLALTVRTLVAVRAQVPWRCGARHTDGATPFRAIFELAAAAFYRLVRGYSVKAGAVASASACSVSLYDVCVMMMVLAFTGLNRGFLTT